MGKFKVNNKTGILFCFVLLETVSGLPFEKIDDVDGEIVSYESLDFSKDNPDLLTRIGREIHDSEDDKSEEETSDEAGVAIDSRFGFYGRKPKPKHRGHGHPAFQGGAGKFPFLSNTMTGDHHHFLFDYGNHQPLFGSGFLGFGTGYHGPVEGFEPWNNGHGIEWDGKYGHGHHHEFGYNPGHNHHHGFGQTHHVGYVPVHDQGHHNGFANHPWTNPGYNYKPPSGFDGSGPIANRPWDGGFRDKVDHTTTQKPTTLPQIDVRVGDH